MKTTPSVCKGEKEEKGKNQKIINFLNLTLSLRCSSTSEDVQLSIVYPSAACNYLKSIPGRLPLNQTRPELNIESELQHDLGKKKESAGINRQLVINK